MPLFRRTRTTPLSVALTGVTMGDRLLLVGCADRDLFTDVTSKVGLSGRACAIVYADAEAARAATLAARAGVLVEIERGEGGFPFDAGSFDLAVIDNTAGLLSESRPEQRVGCLQETFRVLRPGARCVVVERAPRGGAFAALTRGREDAHYASGGGTAAALEAEGFSGVRVLAEREGRRFVEGIRKR